MIASPIEDEAEILAEAVPGISAAADQAIPRASMQAASGFFIRVIPLSLVCTLSISGERCGDNRPNYGL